MANHVNVLRCVVVKLGAVFLSVLLGGFVGGCKGSVEPVVPLKTSEVGVVEEGGDGKPVEAVLRNGSRGVGVNIVATGEDVASLEELRVALPGLPGRAREDGRYIHQLAYGVMNVLDNDWEYVRNLASLEEDYGQYLDPADVLGRRSWDSGLSVSGPGLDDVKPPRWEGEKLVVDSVKDLDGKKVWFSGTRHTFTFGADGWTREHASIPDVAVVAKRANAALEESFGGKVGGFIRVTAAPGDMFGADVDAVYVALSPGEGASRFMWRTGGETEGFGTWDAFQKATGAFGTPETLAHFADELFGMLEARRLKHDTYKVIVSGPAYKAEYEAGGYGRHVLAYHGDQRRTTLYRNVNFDAITGPVIEGERLVAYFKDGRGQPNRLEVDLGALTWDTELEMEEMFESSSVEGLLP